MVNESLLLETLVSTTITIKEVYILVISVGSEIAALRDTVRALDPAFDEVLAQKRSERSLYEEAKQTAKMLDEITLRLKAELIR